MKRSLSVFTAILILAGTAGAMDLAGPWTCQLDPDDQGVDQAWYTRALPERIQLPGDVASQGLGDLVSMETKWTGNIRPEWFSDPRWAPYQQPGNIKMPFWLQPDRYYAGAVWYQRTVDIPPSWGDRRIVLHLERPHWETRVWVDDALAGTCNRLGTPHRHDLTTTLTPGPHRLTIRVDNRMIVNVGPNSHSMTDHTQGNWNGVVGALRLEAGPRVWIDELQVHAEAATGRVRAVVTLGNHTDRPGAGRLVANCGSVRVETEAAWDADGGEAELVLHLGPDAPRWDEFSPHLHALQVTLHPASPGPDASTVHTTFGLRDLSTEGSQFVLNGQKLFLRGTLECCIFPRTGYPPTQVEAWKKIIRACQAHGLNHMRFHSWCPPEAAFVAADELGFYVQAECSSWANQGAKIGAGQVLDTWLYEEAAAMIKAYGNHPSFMFMAYGNEPSGPGRGADFLSPWCTYWKARDARRLHTSGAGWPLIRESDFHSSPDPRIQRWGEGLKSILNGAPPQTQFDYAGFVAQHADKPTISHEIGQWCVYPRFEEMSKYTGVLKAKNFEIFRDFLKQRDMGEQGRDFFLASGKWQTLCYKADIEAALRTPGFGGFQLLDLHDFPGQGTALVGVLDPFWEEKGYVSPEAYRQFCGPVVPLARMARRTWSQDDRFRADIELAQFGPGPLETSVSWKIRDDAGRVLKSGQFPPRRLPVDNGVVLGTVEAECAALPAPARHTLVVSVDGTDAVNQWSFWVYPAEVDRSVPENVQVVHALTEPVLERLQQGGDVLLLADPRRVETDVQLGFSPVFWNTMWTGGQAPHTLGVLCDPEHPVFAGFPTDYHTNWQWWELVHGASAMVLNDLPSSLRPLVQPIDTWFRAHKLGLLFEARVGDGRLVVCSMDLESDLDERIVTRQFRHSLLRYMAGSMFAPDTTVDPAAVQALFRAPSRLEALGATVQADSAQVGFEALRAIDGDPDTIWHTRWEPAPDAMPHELILDLQQILTLQGMTFLPRQDMTNGRPANYQVWVSRNEQDPGVQVAAGTWANTPKKKTVLFDAAVQGRLLKLLVQSEVNGQPYASAAEIDILTP